MVADLDVYVRTVSVRVLFLEPGLVRVRVGVHNAVVAVLVLVLGVLMGVLGVGVLVRRVLVLVRMDIYSTASVLGHTAPLIEACYMDKSIVSRSHLLSGVRAG